jgi:hypothetical protein
MWASYVSDIDEPRTRNHYPRTIVEDFSRRTCGGLRIHTQRCGGLLGGENLLAVESILYVAQG